MTRHSPIFPTFAAIASLMGTASTVLAEVTQDEALKSIRDNMGQPVDLSRIGWVVAGLLVVMVLLLYLEHRRKARRSAKALNSKSKLIREVTKAVGLKPAEIKKVRAMADQLKSHHSTDVDNHLVLLLCPSLLAKAMKKPQE